MTDTKINVEVVSNCMCCGSVLEQVFFKQQYPLLTSACSSTINVPVLPLAVAICSSCSHVQLLQRPNTAALDFVYQGDYTSVIPNGVIPQADQMALDCKSFLDFAFPNGLQPEDPVLEIGCFDGSFLSLFEGHPLWGVEPNKVGEIAQAQHGVEVNPVYFEAGLYKDNSVGLVIMRHLIEHVSDPAELLRACELVLKPHGVLLIETPNIEHTLENHVIGNFYHQHLHYFTKHSLIQLLNREGWEVLAHGIRDFRQFVVCRLNDKKPQKPQIDFYHQYIKDQFIEFSTYVETLQKNLAAWLAANEGLIVIYGASSIATGIIHLANIPTDRVAYAVDRDPRKQGKVLPGTDIVVVAPERLKEGDVSTVLIASDFFKYAILDAIRDEFSDALTKVIFCHPQFEEIELHK
ncbi:MAG: methyltransferase domain-containing protein [Magnetovibrio sp.]|nr:methyltransferase domain-containing protein [Magnetovibrio sp.]